MLFRSLEVLGLDVLGHRRLGDAGPLRRPGVAALSAAAPDSWRARLAPVLVAARPAPFAAPCVAPGRTMAAAREVATAPAAIVEAVAVAVVGGAMGVIAPCAGLVAGTAVVVAGLPRTTALAVPVGAPPPVVAREAALAEGVPILPASPCGASEAVPGRSRCSAGGRLAPAVDHVVSRFLVAGAG